MTNWLILWKTWIEGDFETPWDFELVEHSNDFKRRTPPYDKISSEQVESVYLSLDQSVVEQFETDYISAVVLAALIEADTVDNAIQSVLNVFNDAEIIKSVEITPELLPIVTQMIKK